MKGSWTARSAWGACALALAILPIQIYLLVIGRHIRVPPGFGFAGFGVILAAVFALVGALLASRQPNNPIGWIFLADGLVFAVQRTAYAYAVNGVLGPSAPWPGAPIGAWINAWVWFPAVEVVATFVFLVFPHGRLLSRRWRAVALACGAFIPLGAFTLATQPGPLENFGSLRNPFAIRSALLAGIGGIGFVGANLIIVACGCSLVIRYRRASTTEREQIKWLAYAAAIAAVTLPLGDLVGSQWKVVDACIVLTILFIPVAIGIAVLRYRLYEIDRIISRTVSYAIVSALLAGSFVLVILVPSALVGTERTVPSWLIAVATLVVAATFQPVRRRVQDTVDRRFNRARYDAVHTVDAFASRLRDEIDIDTLANELRVVVMRTMHPEHVALWVPARNRS